MKHKKLLLRSHHYILVMIMGVLSLLPHVVKGSQTADFVYSVEQNGTSHEVTPLIGNLSITDFYNYNSVPSSADTGLEKSDTSLLFLYEDGSGNLSLVMIHDKANDDGGGEAIFTFSGVPGGTSFVVRDDGRPVEGILPTSSWLWSSCCTDGGALSGSLNQVFTITIDPDFRPFDDGQIENWEYLTGSLDNPTIIALDPTEPVTISSVHRPIDVPADIKPQSCPNPLNRKSRGVLPAAILGTADFDTTQIDPTSVRLMGVAPSHSAVEDVATPFVPFMGRADALDCTDENHDGLVDLTLKFDKQEVIQALESSLGREVADGEVLILPLTGNLLEAYEAIPIQGEDVVIILNK